MAALRLVMAAVLAGGVLFTPENLRSIPYPADHISVSRGELVRTRYLILARWLRAYYESLITLLKANAPDLLQAIEYPHRLQHGYQILPKIIAQGAREQSRPRSAWYSWPWTDELITNELKEIIRSQAGLRSGPVGGANASRMVYEKLARNFEQARSAVETIHAHIRYNRLWQNAIAADRAGYDRQTQLHDAVLEREAILAALKAHVNARFNNATGLPPFDSGGAYIALIEREKLLARRIREALDDVHTPGFLTIKNPNPHLWIVHIPVYTDIENREFFESVKQIIENTWRFRDERDEFRVELSKIFVPTTELYSQQQSPGEGDDIDPWQHQARFPTGGAILTTGAFTTHAYGRAIILGPDDITPRVLAHEFGHILGFPDSYFRGYKDLGNDGFQVKEVVADPEDIMGAPETGSVLRRHFETLLRASRRLKTSRHPSAALRGSPELVKGVNG